MEKYQEYQEKALGVLNKIIESQEEPIQAAAEIIAKHIANNGILYLLQDHYTQVRQNPITQQQ